jgi:DNA-binding CsgD family transcriptional regulator
VSGNKAGRRSNSHSLVEINLRPRLGAGNDLIPEEQIEPSTSAKSEDYGLTSREKQILKLLVDGPSLKEIAVKLGVSYNTMIPHIKHIHVKLQVNTRGAVVAKALREHLV